MGMTERRAPPARPGLWRAAAPIAPIALLLCAGAAHAAGTEPALACEPGPQARAATTPAQLQAALPDELVRLPQCQDDSAWFAWAGWALNQLGRYEEGLRYAGLLRDRSPEPRTRCFGETMAIESQYHFDPGQLSLDAIDAMDREARS